MYCNPYKSIVFFKLFLLSVFLYAEKQTITFFRPVEPEQQFNCDLKATNKRSFTVTNQGSEKPKSESSLITVTLKGKMTVKTVLYGHPATSQFHVTHFTAKKNGQPITSSLSGQTLNIILTEKTSSFNLKNSNNKLSDDEKHALSLLFRPVSKLNLNDLMGTKHPLSLNSKWAAPTGAVIDAFQKRGVKILPSQVNGVCSVTSKGKFKTLDYWQIEETLKVSGIPDFAFSFKALIWLPTNSKLGPIRIQRSAVEQAEKTLSNQATVLSKGLRVKAVISETFNAYVIPVIQTDKSTLH
jgi:hypothetical protein